MSAVQALFLRRATVVSIAICGLFGGCLRASRNNPHERWNDPGEHAATSTGGGDVGAVHRGGGRMAFDSELKWWQKEAPPDDCALDGASTPTLTRRASRKDDGEEVVTIG